MKINSTKCPICNKIHQEKTHFCSDECTMIGFENFIELENKEKILKQKKEVNIKNKNIFIKKCKD